MKKTRRTSRVGENVRNALVEVFRHDLKGIDLGLTSMTEVEVSPDLHYARVYMSGLNEDEARKTIDTLQEARGRIRHALGQRIHLRYTPELDFRYDETTMKASRIESILYDISQQEKQRLQEEQPDDAESESEDDETDETDGTDETDENRTE
ncbi:MAG TPA: 30S ribosome-binding factor RbfA [Thermoanaerobaculia bacterium]|jgi:ribosome-binding factor A